MQHIRVEVQSRTDTKKLRQLVKSGTVPAVIYDQSGHTDNIQLPAKVAQKLLATIVGTPLVDIVIDGKEPRIAVLKEVQIDKRYNETNHLSFMELDPKKPAVFEIDIVLVGESPAVKNSLGVLIHTNETLELRGLPGNIPSTIEADISVLGQIGDKITVDNLKIPEGLEFIHEEDKHNTVASIQPFQKEEVVEEKAAEEVAEGEEGAEGEDQGEGAEGTEDKTEGEGEGEGEAETEGKGKKEAKGKDEPDDKRDKKRR